MRSCFKKTTSVLLITFQLCSIFLFGLAGELDGKDLLLPGSTPSIETYGIASFITVLSSSLSEQVRLITDFTCIVPRLNTSSVPCVPESKKNSPSDLYQDRAGCSFIDAKPDLRLAVFQAITVSTIDYDLNAICFMWICSFLSLFWLRRLRFFYGLPRGCIDYLKGIRYSFASLACANEVFLFSPSTLWMVKITPIVLIPKESYGGNQSAYALLAYSSEKYNTTLSFGRQGEVAYASKKTDL